jgi:hypothetical protein
MILINKVESHLETPDDTRRAIKRRGLIAGAAALVTGLIAQQSAQSVVAATGDPLTAGNAFTETSIFILKNTFGTVSAPPRVTTGGDAAIFQAADGFIGVTGYGYGSSSGVYGVSDNGSGAVKGVCNPTATAGLSGGYGVFGQVNNPNGTGVYGKANTTSGFGLYGEANGTGGTGMRGDAVGGTGVHGFSGSTGVPSTVTPNAGVFGTGARTGAFGFSGGTNGTGVLGQCDGASGTGIKGVSASGAPIIGSVEGSGSATNGNAGVLGKGTSGPGVQGQSTAGHGLIGYTAATDGHAALIGYAQAAGGVGLIGRAPGSAGAWAGVFYGDLAVNGALQVYGAPKNAVIKHPKDGTYRALYCTESPESWFEDVGEGTLSGDRATITLDPDFAVLVHTDRYHVFLTPYGPRQLHVAERTARGFTVVATPTEAPASGDSKQPEGVGTFSWRVMAKRKDIAGERLAKVTPPLPPKAVTPFVVPETP